MSLFRLLKYTSLRTVWAAIIVGITGGASSALIISLISRQLTGNELSMTQFALYFVGLLIVVIGLDLAADWLLIRLAASTGYELGVHLVDQILATPLRRLEQIGSPRLLASLTEDVSAISNALNTLPTLSISMSIVIGCLIYLAWLAPMAILVLGLLMIPAVAGHLFLHKKAKQMARLALRERDTTYTQYRMLTEGIKELQVNRQRQSAFANSLLSPTLSSFRGKLVKTRTLHSFAKSLSQAMYFVFILALFVISPTLKVDDAILTSYALIALYMRGSVNGVLTSLPQWSLATVAIREIERLGFSFERGAAEHPAQPTEPVSTQPTTIHLQNVTHAYTSGSEESGFTLGPIDLTLHSGQLIFLAGGNGSGKTTLVKLLVGLYTPEAGTISLNGEPINQENLEAYRQNFSVIFSDFYLFEQLLGIEDVNLDSAALGYLMKLQLSHKVKVEDGKLSTINLSQGQRQRLALLTAYMEDRPIYVFDEWAAGQDPHFKDIFYRELLRELRQRGKLVIVISHDDHYFDVADRLIKLDFGQLVSDSNVQMPVASYAAAI